MTCVNKVGFNFSFAIDRWRSLQTGVETRLLKLQEALRDFGPDSQHILSGRGLADNSCEGLMALSEFLSL